MPQVPSLPLLESPVMLWQWEANAVFYLTPLAITV